MKENKNKKFHFRLPKLTPLVLIMIPVVFVILFLIIAIPVVYVNEYNSTKATLFANDLENVNKKEIVYGNKNTKMDFEFVLYCTNYENANDTNTIKFQAFAYENSNTRNVINLSSKIKVRIGMYSDWIKVEQTSSSYEKNIGTGPRTAKRFDFTVYNIPKLPKKGKLPFVNIKSIPVYAYITYSTIVNGTETTKRYILKYNYNDYAIEAKTIVDNREKELNVSSSKIQWRYKNDTSWTDSISTDDLIGIETRVTDTSIQWKRKCDTEWTNLKTISDLPGYIEGTTPQVRIENNYIQCRFNEEDSWNSLVSISSLKEIDVRVNEDYVQWKRKNQTEYTNLIAIKDLENYTAEKSITLRVSNSTVQWRYTDTTTWNTIQTVDSIIGIRARFDENRNVQWKCEDETEWKNLLINGEQVTEANLDKNPIKYGPTAGGIN